MKKAFILGAALMLFAGVASAQYCVEFDTDGAVNGANDVAAGPSGTVTLVDCWASGPADPLISFNFTIIESGPATWGGYAYAGLGGTEGPTVNTVGDNYTVQWTDFGGGFHVPPFLHGTATYTHGATDAVISINPAISGSFSAAGAQGTVDACNSATLEGDPVSSATEESSWSAVKDLFR